MKIVGKYSRIMAADWIAGLGFQLSLLLTCSDFISWCCHDLALAYHWQSVELSLRASQENNFYWLYLCMESHFPKKYILKQFLTQNENKTFYYFFLRRLVKYFEQMFGDIPKIYFVVLYETLWCCGDWDFYVYTIDWGTHQCI